MSEIKSIIKDKKRTSKGQLLLASQHLSRELVFVDEEEAKEFHQTIMPKYWKAKEWQAMNSKPKIERLKIAKQLLEAEIERLEAIEEDSKKEQK